MVSQEVGYDAGKNVKGRKRFLTVDTLGLVLRVLITAASMGERKGGKRVLKSNFLSSLSQKLVIKKKVVKIGLKALLHRLYQ